MNYLENDSDQPIKRPLRLYFVHTVYFFKCVGFFLFFLNNVFLSCAAFGEHDGSGEERHH